MTNEEIAERFKNFAALMEVRSDDPFRMMSYRNAAETIETWPVPLEEIAAKDGIEGLQALPGIGRAISGKAMELLEKGTFDAWEETTKETPATVLDLMKVRGIGPKTAALLHNRFKVSSLDELREFAAGGGLEMVDGLGEKSAGRIKQSLKSL